MKHRLLAGVVTAALVGVAFTSESVHAGPPLLCHEIEIGDSPSLPWGKSAFEVAGDYSVARVVDDALRLLTPEQPVLTRMETMRRAALYLHDDHSRAESLFGSLLTRVLDAEVTMDEKVLAARYFDAGYFAATLQQAGVEVTFGPTQRGASKLHPVPGYAWAVRGYKLADQDADMALGLALITADSRMSEHEMFVARAANVIEEDDKPRNDLLQWIGQIRGTSLEALRAKYRKADGDRPR